MKIDLKSLGAGALVGFVLGGLVIGLLAQNKPQPRYSSAADCPYLNEQIQSLIKQINAMDLEVDEDAALYLMGQVQGYMEQAKAAKCTITAPKKEGSEEKPLLE